MKTEKISPRPVFFFQEKLREDGNKLPQRWQKSLMAQNGIYKMWKNVFNSPTAQIILFFCRLSFLLVSFFYCFSLFHTRRPVPLKYYILALLSGKFIIRYLAHESHQCKFIPRQICMFKFQPRQRRLDERNIFLNPRYPQRQEYVS